jgi:hypothetical protein
VIKLADSHQDTKEALRQDHFSDEPGRSAEFRVAPYGEFELDAGIRKVQSGMGSSAINIRLQPQGNMNIRNATTRKWYISVRRTPSGFCR